MVDEEMKNLEAKIRAAKAVDVKHSERASVEGNSAESDMSMGVRAGTEFIVSILASAGIGYGIDYYFGTKPIFMLIFILLGTGAGFMAIFKISQNLGAGVGFVPLHNDEKHCKEGGQVKENDINHSNKGTEL